MKLYQRRCTQPLKWMVALVIFMLTLGVTFTDVYGMGRDRGRRPGNHQHNNGGSGCQPGDTLATNDNPSPTAVPEPGTFILLAGGLGAMYAARRLRKQK